MSTKRMWMLEEFAAHVGSVNCLALGHKSGRVMVTGGEDRKVSMWALGKPNCLLSLAGHTTPVESVRFSNGEDMVIAGSLSGALKIWDLESVKIVRTLTGHKSSAKTVAFHPFGDYVASGSLDTNIKLWDIRKKGCIFTYKGHSNSVNCLRFSPDGRWIVSGGEDGVIKLWDLGAGKMLTEFKNHSSSVSTLEFHPNEFLLATGSADRTVKFWDLESMQMVCSTDADTLPIRSIVFHPDSASLYCAMENQLKVYGWEPYQCYDTLSTGWGRISDIAIVHNQLVGASFSHCNVSTFIVDLERIQSASSPVAAADVPNTRPPTTTSHRGRRSFISVEQPEAGLAKCFPKSKEELEESEPVEEVAAVTEAQDLEKYRQVFQAKSKLSYSPPMCVKPFPAPPEDASTSSRSNVPESEPHYNVESQSAVVSSGVTQAPTRPLTSSSSKKEARTKKIVPRTGRVDSSEDSVRQPKGAMHGENSQTRHDKDTPGSKCSTTRDEFTVDIRVAPRRAPRVDDNMFIEDFKTMSLNDNSSAARIKAEEFLQKPLTSSNKKIFDDDEALLTLRGGHDVMMSVLVSRHRNLQVVKAMWSAGNVRTAIESALSMNDQAVIHDVTSLMLNKTALWNLELCVLLIPALAGLTASKHENYIRTGFDALKHILRQFGPIVKSNITAPPSVGVDISREERYSKCMSCYKLLMNFRTDMEHKPGLSDEATRHYRELRLLLSQLD